MGMYLEALLGPLLAFKSGHQEQYLSAAVLLAVLIPAILIGCLRPKDWTILISVLGVLAWVFSGFLYLGAGC